MSAVVGPLRMAPGNRSGIAHDRLVECLRGALLLQSRINPGRGRRGGRRAPAGEKRRPPAESHSSRNGKAHAKSFHIVPPRRGRTRCAWPLDPNSFLIIAFSRQLHATCDFTAGYAPALAW